MLRARAFVLLLSLAGCDGDSAPSLSEPREVRLLEDYVAAIEARDRLEYDRLHAEGFEVILLDQDGACMPWFEEAYWSGAGGGLCWNGTLTVRIVLIEGVSEGEGAEKLRTRASVGYLVNPPSDGWIAETGLDFDTWLDGEQLMIIRVTENKR